MKHNLLKSVIISVILLMGVSNAWGADNNNINNITSVYIRGGMNGWANSNDWKLSQGSDANNWKGTFYLNTTQEFKMYINSKYYACDGKNFNSASTYQDYLYSNGGSNMKITRYNTTGANGYVKLDVELWGNYGNGSYNTSRLQIKQSLVTALSPSLSANKTALIAAEKSTITASCSGGSGSYTYTYKVTCDGSDVTNSTLSATTGASVTFTAPSVTGKKTYTITVTAKDSHALLSELATKTATKTITVEEAHNVTVSYKYGSTTIKPNTTTSNVKYETASSITAPTITGYKFSSWTLGNGITNRSANTTTNPISITSKSSGTYTLTANYTEDLTSNWKLIGDNQTNSPFGDNYTYSSGKAMTKKSGHSTESNVYITLDIKHLPASYYGFKVATSNSDNDKYGYGQGAGDYIEFNRSASNSQKQVYNGSQHELKFIPDALGEYEFRVNYPNDKYVYVTFPTAYTVTFGKGTGGSSVTAKYSNTSFSSGKKVQSGKTVTFTQSASAGYTFKEWNTKSDGTGTKLSGEATYTHTVVANNTVYAIYTKNPDNIVYLKPSHSWKSNNAQFAVKYGGTNHMMTEVEECCEEKYYKVTIPSQYSKFNFVRLSDNRTTEWNVTGEISVPTDGKNLYDMTKIYLKPNGNWKSGNARFAAYFFNSQDNLNKNKWMSMLPTDEDGIFYCDFPTDHIFDRVSLTRMNGAESYNDWAYRWNQTKDIDLFQGYNSYELEEGKWGKDNSNPQKDDDMDVIYKCKWTTYNPTYSVTLEPTPYGHYTVEYNGRTYKSATDKNVVIEDVALGVTIRVSKGTPDNSAEYTDDMLLQKASGYGNIIELKGQEYYDHTICGTTTIAENFITKNPHTVYLRVPTTIEAAWNDDDQGLSKGANCVYYRHIMAGGIHIMDNVTNSINGEDGYSYYQLTIPAGYRTFCFQRKSESEPQNYSPRNYTKDFTHILPFINGLNCFTILGSNDDQYYYGEWGTLLQEGDYRLLYVEQVVEKDADGYTVITRKKAHPSNIIKKGTASQIVSLHTYKDRTYTANAGGVLTYTSSNNPEIILQKYLGNDQWQDVECQMVYGPIETIPAMGQLPGRKNASPTSDIDDLQYHNGIEIIKQDVLNHPDKGNGVWNFVVKQVDGKASVQWNETHRYTGEYYIRTDNAEGGWDQYTLNDNYMTRSDVSKQHSNYSHYYCKWIGEAGVNVKYTIANDYGIAISDTLEADKTDLWGNELATKMVGDDQILPANANVRFSWNEKTNFLHRAYIAGSANVQDRFLVLRGNNNNVGIFDDKTGNNLNISGLNPNEQIFVDNSNWIYHADVQMLPGAEVQVTAKYNDKTQYFVGKEGEFSNTVLQGVGSQKYLIRLLYDFKTNELISAYVPGNNSDIEAIETNLMLIRKGNEPASQLAFNTKSMDETGKTAYGVIEFPYELLTDNTLDIYKRSLYWISFPFDVNLKDAFSFGQYGVHWLIQEYDGASRAEKGLWAETDTYWKLHWDPTNIVLKAGKGYVIEIDIARICTDYATTFNKAGHSVAIYFPSKEPISSKLVQNPGAVTIDVPEHTCTIPIRDTPYGNRQIRDSHWNVIGVPSYINAGATFSNPVMPLVGDRALMYYYRWDGFDNYSPQTAQNDHTYASNFQSMFAYMVQYAGNLTWNSVVNETTPAAIAAKKNSDNIEEHHLRLELLQNGSEVDRTFVQMREDDVTPAFDFNHDLCKITNKGLANIYSLITTETYPIEVAANVLPIQETVIPVGVVISAAGEYTFAMPEGTDGIVVELIDYETNTTTNLLLDNYTVNLGKGTFETRFALHVKPDKTVTGVENITTPSHSDVRKFIIDGILYMQKDGVLYDAQGKLVR